MDSKLRVPRLRSVVMGIVVTAILFSWMMHRNVQREFENQKATGLGAVAGGWDPISLFQEGSLRRGAGRIRNSSPGVIGGVPNGGGGGGDRDSLTAPTFVSAEVTKASSPEVDHKLIHSVGLQLLVRNAADASAEIERITASLHGEIEKVDLHNYGSSQEGEITLRVPASHLDDAIARFSGTAMRVQDQHREARDIAREFMDSEAHLRNMKAEEQQYLVLLRRAGSMKDTLEVTEKISEVRGEIEQLQGTLNWWSHQVEMSAVQIHLTEEPEATMVARWRPLYNAKNSAAIMLHDLGDWVDWIVALVINIPVIAVWFASVGSLLLFGWKILRWVWFRFFRPTPATPTVA